MLSVRSLLHGMDRVTPPSCVHRCSFGCSLWIGSVCEMCSISKRALPCLLVKATLFMRVSCCHPSTAVCSTKSGHNISLSQLWEEIHRINVGLVPGLWIAFALSGLLRHKSSPLSHRRPQTAAALLLCPGSARGGNQPRKCPEITGSIPPDPIWRRSGLPISAFYSNTS